MSELEILKKPFFWLFLLLILVYSAIFSLPDNKLHIIFCDVGQGDATLISFKKTQILIDGGPDNRVLVCLSHHLPFWDRKIEMVILTHPEKDHFGGLLDVIKRYNVRYFVFNDRENFSASFKEFKKAKNDKQKILSFVVKSGDKIKIGPLRFLVLWPAKENLISDEFNDSSIVLKFSYGSFDVFLPGDISEKVERLLDLPFSKVEVLKVAHHGSRYSTSKEFLEKIRPILAIISVGKNSFGHPSQEIIKRLQSLGIKFLRTDKSGEIEIVSDGSRWYTK